METKRNSEINKFTVHFPSGLITLGSQRTIIVDIFLCKLPIVWINRTHDIKIFLILAMSSSSADDGKATCYVDLVGMKLIWNWL
jgi:hypothetical protein